MDRNQSLLLPNTDDIDQIREFALMKAQQYSREVEISLKRERDLMDSIIVLRKENERLVMEKIENQKLCEEMAHDFSVSKYISEHVSVLEQLLLKSRHELASKGQHFSLQLSSIEKALDSTIEIIRSMLTERWEIHRKAAECEKAWSHKCLELSVTNNLMQSCRAELSNTLMVNRKLIDQIHNLEKEASLVQQIRYQLEDSEERVVDLNNRLTEISRCMRTESQRLKDESTLRCTIQERFKAHALRSTDRVLKLVQRELLRHVIREWRRVVGLQQRANDEESTMRHLNALENITATLPCKLLEAAARIARARAADRAVLDQALQVGDRHRQTAAELTAELTAERDRALRGRAAEAQRIQSLERARAAEQAAMSRELEEHLAIAAEYEGWRSSAAQELERLQRRVGELSSDLVASEERRAAECGGKSAIEFANAAQEAAAAAARQEREFLKDLLLTRLEKERICGCFPCLDPAAGSQSDIDANLPEQSACQDQLTDPARTETDRELESITDPMRTETDRELESKPARSRHGGAQNEVLVHESDVLAKRSNALAMTVETDLLEADRKQLPEGEYLTLVEKRKLEGRSQIEELIGELLELRCRTGAERGKRVVHIKDDIQELEPQRILFLDPCSLAVERPCLEDIELCTIRIEEILSALTLQYRTCLRTNTESNPIPPLQGMETTIQVCNLEEMNESSLFYGKAQNHGRDFARINNLEATSGHQPEYVRGLLQQSPEENTVMKVLIQMETPSLAMNSMHQQLLEVHEELNNMKNVYEQELRQCEEALVTCQQELIMHRNAASQETLSVDELTRELEHAREQALRSSEKDRIQIEKLSESLACESQRAEAACELAKEQLELLRCELVAERSKAVTQRAQDGALCDQLADLLTFHSSRTLQDIGCSCDIIEQLHLALEQELRYASGRLEREQHALQALHAELISERIRSAQNEAVWREDAEELAAALAAERSRLARDKDTNLYRISNEGSSAVQEMDLLKEQLKAALAELESKQRTTKEMRGIMDKLSQELDIAKNNLEYYQQLYQEPLNASQQQLVMHRYAASQETLSVDELTRELEHAREQALRSSEKDRIQIEKSLTCESQRAEAAREIIELAQEQLGVSRTESSVANSETNLKLQYSNEEISRQEINRGGVLLQDMMELSAERTSKIADKEHFHRKIRELRDMLSTEQSKRQEDQEYWSLQTSKITNELAEERQQRSQSRERNRVKILLLESELDNVRRSETEATEDVESLGSMLDSAKAALEELLMVFYPFFRTSIVVLKSAYQCMMVTFRSILWIFLFLNVLDLPNSKKLYPFQDHRALEAAYEAMRSRLSEVEEADSQAGTCIQDIENVV